MVALLVKDNIAQGMRARQEVGNPLPDYELNSIERRIESKDFDLRMAEAAIDSDKILREAQESPDKKSNKKPPNSNAANFEQEKTAEIQKLKVEKGRLIAERDELLKKRQAENDRPRTWGEWFDDYNVRFLLATIPLVTLALWLVPLTFWRRLPDRNPFSLTDFERRCVLFLPVAIIISAFGFMLFVWYLSIAS
jgi:hypothetical protein